MTIKMIAVVVSALISVVIFASLKAGAKEDERGGMK